jgi:CBS domain-containing protein
VEAAPLCGVDDTPMVSGAALTSPGWPVRQVADIMTPVPVTIDAAMSVDEAVRLMLEHGVTGLPVMHGRSVVGVITQADLLMRLVPRNRVAWWTVLINHERLARECQQARGTMVGEVMSRPAVVAAADDPLEVAARLLQEYRIGRLPVLDRSRLVGIVTQSDLLQALIGSPSTLPQSRPRPAH